MKSSAASGTLAYPELCVAAKSEEQYQAELRQRQQYRRAEQARRDTHPSPSTSLSTQARRVVASTICSKTVVPREARVRVDLLSGCQVGLG